jgi:hypothetical protein
MTASNYITWTVGLGHDLADGFMVPFFVQPFTDLVAPVFRGYGAGGAVREQGLFTCFHWTHLNDEDEYMNILVQLGLDSDDTSEVTIYARNARLVKTKYNAVAQLPEGNQDIKWSNFFPRDIGIYFVDMEETSA